MDPADPEHERLPIFPLPNVVLFPQVLLPLHIFEPRYRAMTRDALEGGRRIGMILLRPGADAALRDAPIFDVGCVGSITESRRLPDGRYHMILRGERRFRIEAEETADTAYRTVRARLLLDPAFSELTQPERADLLSMRERLSELVLEVAQLTAPRAVAPLQKQIESLDPISLVHAVAFGLDSTPLEKQGLLEGSSASERCRLLIQLLEFRKAQQRLPEPPRSLN